MSDFALVLAVALAGGLASVLRLTLSKWHGWLPWGILLANSAASLGLGLVLHLAQAGQPIVVAGICGGLSTFSSVVAASGEYLRGRLWLKAALYTALSFAIPFTALTLGAFVGPLLLN